MTLRVMSLCGFPNVLRMFISTIKYKILLYTMISTKPEIENIINNKFMKRIQTTTVYNIDKPDIYENIKENVENIVLDDSESQETFPSTYGYLNDEQLDKVVDITPETQFNYVLYTIIDDSVTPYVKFLMTNTNNIMKFSHENAIIENMSDVESSSDSETDDIIPFLDDDEEEGEDDLLDMSSNITEYDEDTSLPLQCSQYLKNNFGIGNDNSNEYYRGYVKVEDKVYVFIDVSIVDMEIPDKEDFSWVIIDEIVNKKHANNIPICKIVVSMFSNNPYIKNIYTENNVITESPICAYICQNEDDMYTNIETTDRLNTSLLPDKITHPVFGTITMFSTKSFLNDNGYDRYSLFTTQANYILHTNFTKSEVDTMNTNSIIRFPHNDVECWAVKDISLFSPI